jgi:hypothetical protein
LFHRVLESVFFFLFYFLFFLNEKKKRKVKRLKKQLDAISFKASSAKQVEIKKAKSAVRGRPFCQV